MSLKNDERWRGTKASQALDDDEFVQFLAGHVKMMFNCGIKVVNSFDDDGSMDVDLIKSLLEKREPQFIQMCAARAARAALSRPIAPTYPTPSRPDRQVQEPRRPRRRRKVHVRGA